MIVHAPVLPSASPPHPVRQGVTLYSGEKSAALAGVRADTVSFVFSIGADSQPASARMTLLHASALDSVLENSKRDFCVVIALSLPAVEELLLGDESPGAVRIRELAAGAGGETSFEFPLTPAARLSVESVRRCPFVGASRSMALTARGNDLLVEFLSTLGRAETPHLVPLTRALNDQIHAAAEILKHDLETPPTLTALARRVGLSETALKRGFRQVFATTVFGYLRTHRMEHARALLQSGEATVLEAAAIVGYSNPSNFASAFRQQFGLNPKTFQLTARR